MTVIWITLGVIVAAVAFAYAWFALLLARFPEPSGVDEIHTVSTGDLWKIRLYRLKPRGDGAGGEPVLLCHGMASNRHVFFTPPGRSLAETLATRGYDCWAVDLRGNRSSEPPYGRNNAVPVFEDYVTRDLPAVMQHIRETTGFGKVHYVGHSMGGMLLYAFRQLVEGDWVASAATVASPPGFAGTHIASKPLVVILARWFRGPLSWAMRSLALFVRMHRAGQDIYPARWENVHPDVDPGFFFHTVEVPPPNVVRQMDQWSSSRTWQAAGRDIEAGLAGFDIPLLCLAAGDDPFVARERVEAFFAALPTEDKKLVILSTANGCQAEYGHVDAMLGLHTREEVFEPIADWFGQHPIQERPADEASDESPKPQPKPKAKRKPRAKASAKEPAAKKPVVKKTPAKKAASKKPVAKRASAKKSAAKAAAKKTPARKPAASKKKGQD